MLKALKQLLSLPYQIVHSLRALLYEVGFLKRRKLDAYVISIGNISFGGTGKTPLTILLAKELSKDFKVAVLTRGYKSGDEVQMMQEEFEKHREESGISIPIGVNKSRYQAGLELLEEENIEVFILDDGLQHLGLDRDLELIVKNCSESGFYRDFPSKYRDADYLVHSKYDEAWAQKYPYLIKIKSSTSLSDLPNPELGICIFSAIADPKSYEKELSSHLAELEIQHGISFKKPYITRKYPDHYVFSLNDVNHLISLGMNLICTYKDFVKIPNEYKNKLIKAMQIVELDPPEVLGEIKGRIKQWKQENKP